MRHSINILEPTDLWYLQNNINKETNKYFHPTKDIPFVQQVDIKLENTGVVIQKGSLHNCFGKLTYGVYKTDNRLKDVFVSLMTDVDYNAPVYRGVGVVKLEPRRKGFFLNYLEVDIYEGEQWELDDGVFQFCSDNVVLGVKKLKWRQMAGSGDGASRIVVKALPNQTAKLVVGTAAPTKMVELGQGEVMIADSDIVKGFTNGVKEEYAKLGSFGRGGGEGYVWIYTGSGRLLVSETDGMALG